MGNNTVALIYQSLFLIVDIVVLINFLRYKVDNSRRQKIFRMLIICTINVQFFGVFTQIEHIRVNGFVTAMHNFVLMNLFVGMTSVSYSWYLYLRDVISGGEEPPRIAKYIASLPCVIMTVACLASPWTHWVFYINNNNEYERGTLFFLQIVCPYIYIFMAVGLAIYWGRKRNKIHMGKMMRFFISFTVPSMICAFIQMVFISGGFTTVGISVGLILMYLEMYIEEISEANRLKSVEEFNIKLQEVNAEQEAQLQEIESLNNQLKENNEIISNSGYGIWRISMSEDGRHQMFANDTLQKLFGIEELNLTPEELYVYYHDRLSDDVPTIERDDYAEMEKGEIKSRILEWCHPEKGIIFLYAGGTSHVLANGEQVISGYCADITEQRLEIIQLNIDLEKAVKQAEKASQAKTDFLFSMSHDIRTPMNAIMGYTGLLEKYKDDSDKFEEYMDKIKTSSNMLLSLINNVLEMARIESGKMTLDEESVSVKDLAKEISSVYAGLMKDKGINFSFDVDVTHQNLHVDKVKISEIYLNLLSNAYKYTPKGGSVTVKIEEQPHEKAGFVWIQAQIADTGIGMSADYLPKVFDEFVREKNTTESKIEGTGLGLPIVKKLIELMGGSITVTSEIGKGSVFTLRHPHRIAVSAGRSRSDEETEETVDFSGKRILLAEDNDLNAEIAKEILSEVGFEVERAEDGIICIDMLRNKEKGYYDLILMDVQMPNLNGYEATKRIRSAGFDIPIYAMTANAFDEDKQNALAAGMNGHLAKPIDVPILLEVLGNALKHK